MDLGLREHYSVTVSVRQLVEFVLRTGDLATSGKFTVSNRALEGTRGHQRLQKSRPEGYLKEVSLEYVHVEPNLNLKILGRVDGIFPTSSPPWLEEIKTTETLWSGPPNSLHLGQRDCYAAIYALQNNLPAMEVVLVYYDLDSGLTTEFREIKSKAELDAFFQKLLTEFLVWARRQAAWVKERDASLLALTFPFAEFRAGQRKLSVETFRTIRDKKRLFAEAPTGIGKSAATLFGAVKAITGSTLERIFFLTAKTAGAASATKALAGLAESGAKLRCVHITAKDRTCFCKDPSRGLNPENCPYAAGYYDKIKPALTEILETGSGSPQLTQLAEKHCVCPFELSLDYSLWCDVIVGDYNYAFDPSASLKRFFAEGNQPAVLLIDEAHNLVDRAREMFSIRLGLGSLESLVEQLAKVPACKRALLSWANQFRLLFEDKRESYSIEKPPAEILAAARKFLAAAEEWLVLNKAANFRDELLTLYFEAHRFVRILEEWTDSMRFIVEPLERAIRLFCTDPSEFLKPTLDRVLSSLFFSATLNPMHYYQKLICGGMTDPTLNIPSPFEPANLGVFVATHIGTDYNARSESLARLAELIAAAVKSREGNHLIYFPSFQYLKDTYALVSELAPNLHIQKQESGMSKTERDQFIDAFQAGGNLVGMAVMGGIFGEAIDLVGDRLIGVVVVGVGLPQISFERNLIRRHYESLEENGFEMAYVFPGMNRVLQAAGRVIRSAEDRGTVLLIDRRFREFRYRNLFPSWWNAQFLDSNAAIGKALEEFWVGKNRAAIDSV